MLYRLKLHEKYHEENGNIEITRVPGGWLYYYAFKNATIFVPYSEEFDDRSKKLRQQYMQAQRDQLFRSEQRTPNG